MASKGSPVSAHSLTRRRGAIDCNRLITCIGNTPTFTSGNPKITWSAATAMSVMHRQPHAAGHADAADPRDRGLGGVLRQPQQIGVIDIRSGKIHRKGGAAVLQVGAGAKRLVARTGQHDDAHFLVVMGVAIAFGDAGDDVAIEALRLSGRLMVIQNACPRFSRITL